MKINFGDLATVKRERYPTGFYISDSNVEALRVDKAKGTFTARQLAMKYNVSVTTVYSVVNRRGRWAE